LICYEITAVGSFKKNLKSLPNVRGQLNWCAILIRSDYFRFGSVFIKKNNQTEIKKKTKPVQTGQFRFGSIWFFKTKTGLARFFPV